MKKLILVPILILADIITKYYFKSSAVINTGITFGFFQDNNLLWIILSFFIIVILIYLYKTEKNYRLGLVFIISGAIGNLIDRLVYGGVIDFINLGFWPAFNLADAFNIIGVLIILFSVYKK